MTTFERRSYHRLDGTYVSPCTVTRNDWEPGYCNQGFDYTPHPIHLTTFSSFTAPNAICPICGDDVYYYENSYGSKVWFDELGIPWSKHPCFESEQDDKVTNTVPPEKTPLIEVNSIVISMPLGDVSILKSECLIKKNIVRGNTSYITSRVFDKNKKEKLIFAVLDKNNLSNSNYVCFIECTKSKNVFIHYFDIEKMQSGKVQGKRISNRKDFIAMAWLKEKDTQPLKQIKDYINKVKNLPEHQKQALASWLYSNTIWDVHNISVFSGLTKYIVSEICDDKIKPTHADQSPVALGLIDSKAFSFLKKKITFYK